VDTLEGEVWTCTVVPNDGDDDGDAATASVTVIEPPTTCGDGVLDPGEEYDPAPGPFSTAPVDPTTCRWDFSAVNQLYCNGSCTWAGGHDCDQPDADILCQLIMDNPSSTASSWTYRVALYEHGFPCPTSGTLINTDRGVSVSVYYTDSDIRSSHGPGEVAAYPVCTDP